MSKFYIRLIFTLIVTIFLCCTPEQKISNDYLGQRPPGLKAEIFALGIVSTEANEHSPLAFSPDGSLLLWAVMDSNFHGSINEMKYKNGSWSNLGTPSFADTTSDDYCPSFSVDGKKLFFSSRRKAPDGYPEGRGNRIWTVDVTKEGYGIPVALDTTVSKAQEFSHDVSKSGTLYFCSAQGGNNADIYKAELSNGKYSKPFSLSGDINTAGYEDGPYISPNEDFLIFESTRAEGIEGSHDLYICFRKNGSWETPINMGPEINSSAMERFATISPDGKYLFFASNRNQSAERKGFDYYWIDAAIIAELKNK